MTIADLLPWLNLLLVPIAAFVVRIKTDVAQGQVLQAEHQRRLDALEGRVTELRSKLGELT